MVGVDMGVSLNGLPFRWHSLAETEAFLRGRGKKERTLSDRMFNSMLTEAGRDLRAMANDATYRAGTQIDNWIVTPGLANVMGRVHTMPGVCGKDHEIVAVEYYGADDPEGEREYRLRGVSRKLDRDAEEAFSNNVQEAYDTAMQTQQNVTPAERLKAIMACSGVDWVACLADPGCGKSDASGLQNS